MNNNRLFRNTNSKVLGGVAAGIADYLDIDVTIVRVLFVLGVFIPVTFPIILFYIVLWIVMPDGARRPKPLEGNRYSA
ncbi:PspC domain-containing protein [Dyadobacter chenwenxiniae]|uniref:PspC domain-containing protein n=1 Tax=Dyadobacter chenwenxiniae TaxID=2906456 RepID=A0A9X1PQ42_9BACT|nr:PspC domain-containing protein [Dyadobacter chenwenxiniae]MCF0051279.1 PspC domain-containing protein [Dyadobacter chenwenxiniae]MCF0065387.1 PspC domain-containing protein [Dyadobacter chenwenxiniae]UON82201.1 PspC domain-containing protein [Dyadobacter chenwenxiniae]